MYLTQTSFKPVKEAFLKACSSPKIKDIIAYYYLHRANKHMGGWIETYLTEPQLARIMLPWHQHNFLRLWHPYRHVTLIPKSGLYVIDAAQRLRTLTDYREKCRECYATLEFVSDKEIGPLFLARGTSFYISSSGPQPGWQEKLIPLDRLHRLVAHFYFHKNPIDRVHCFIAIPQT